jgi:hypothetical protein
MLEPLTGCFTADVARRVVSLPADPNIQSRVTELAEKANEGTLSDDERTEYAEYVEAADVVGIIQAKARRVLAQGA